MKKVLSIKNKLLQLLGLYIILNILYIVLPYPIHAAYVLPYPSYMPGNKLYSVSRMIDAMKKYWYFGAISQVKYHLELSDKYLVEAKTLFEYKQYLLATDALLRSTEAFQALESDIKRAVDQHKDMRVFVGEIEDAGSAHQEVLLNLKSSTPETFRWTPEKASASDLFLSEELDLAYDAIDVTVEKIKQL